MANWGMLESRDQTCSSNAFEIPKEWQKANEALRVQKLKTDLPSSAGSTATTTTTTTQLSTGVVNYSYPYWPSQMFGYGYTNVGYPPYNYYNMGNFPSTYGSYYGVPQMPMNSENQIMTGTETNNATPSIKTGANNTEGQSVSETVNLLASQPPPPPPTPPPEEIKIDDFKFKNNQAPGAGNIRFSLPKQNKTNKFGGFQNMRGGKSPNFGQMKQNSIFRNRLSLPMSPAPQNSSTEQVQLSPKEKPKKLDFFNEEWPPSLRKYVQNAFDKCKTQLDKDQVEIILKGKLSKAYNDKSLWKKDWATEPLPNIYSERIEKEEIINGFIPLKVGSVKNWSLAKEFNKSMPKRKPHLKSRSRSHSSIHSERIEKEEIINGFIPLKVGSVKNWGLAKEFNKSMPKPKPHLKSRSRSRSRSRSFSPHSRRVVRRKKYSESDSSSSSHGTPPKKRNLSSYSASTSEGNNNKWNTTENNKFNTPENNNKWNTHENKGNKWNTSELNNAWNTRGNKKKKNKKKNKLQSVFAIDGELASDDRMQRRAARFETKKGNSLLLTIKNSVTPAPVEDPLSIDWSSYAISGTCQDIEKPFLRLTSAVDPSTIRPVSVLVQSLQMVKEHWTQKQDYNYACEQLKSIRQDLTVQCIRDNFTIQAYETHARLAIEKGDRTEFNQCQNQLRVLHEEVKSGSRLEFIGYRILYNIHTKNTREITKILTSLSLKDKQDEVIQHALALNKAWMLNNFHVFFKLYRVAPKMSGYMIDWFLQRERTTGLKIMIKSFRQTLPIAFAAKELGFPSEKECLSFIQEAQCVLSDDRSSILCKESFNSFTSEGC